MVGILPTCDGSASLRLSDEEYEKLWSSFVAFTRKGWDLTLRSYVESITGRQVALVAYCMDYVRAEVTNEMLDPAVLNRNAIFKLTGPPFIDSLQLVRSLKYSRDFLMQGKTAEHV